MSVILRLTCLAIHVFDYFSSLFFSSLSLYLMSVSVLRNHFFTFQSQRRQLTFASQLQGNGYYRSCKKLSASADRNACSRATLAASDALERQSIDWFYGSEGCKHGAWALLRASGVFHRWLFKSCLWSRRSGSLGRPYRLLCCAPSVTA